MFVKLATCTSDPPGHGKQMKAPNEGVVPTHPPELSRDVDACLAVLNQTSLLPYILFEHCTHLA